jgi:tetratricopeptide (TPR) repeat protein
MATALLIFAALLGLLLFRGIRRRHQVRWRMTHNQADLASKQREWDQAARLFQKALELTAKLRPPSNHVCASETQFHLGIVRYRQNRLDEARHLFHSAIQSLESAGLKQHMWASLAKCQLGQMEADQGEFASAFAWFHRALADDEATSNAALQIFDLQLMGHAALDMGDFPKALEYFERCEEQETKVIHKIAAEKGQDLSKSSTISMSLPDVRFAQRRFADAEKLLKEKVDYYSRFVMREDNIDLGRFAYRYAQCLWETGKKAEALAAMQDAAGLYGKDWSPDHARVLKCKREITRMQQEIQAAEAQPVL